MMTLMKAQDVHHQAGHAEPPGRAGPRSIARRINGERLAILGWGRAVLPQFAHPLVAAGVADHSGFRSSPRDKVERLGRTLRAMLALTFGTPHEAEQAARGIDAIHGRVSGRLPAAVGVFPAGTPYSARDPELLRWMHATLVDSMLLAYTRLVGPLSRAERDRYCAETAWVATALGVPVELPPQDTGQLRAYLDEMYASGKIVVGPTGRALGRALFESKPGPAGLVDLPLRLSYGLVTAGFLSPELRSAYGFRWSPTHAAAFRTVTRTARLIVPRLPDRARRWPEARRPQGAGSRDPRSRQRP